MRYLIVLTAIVALPATAQATSKSIAGSAEPNVGIAGSAAPNVGVTAGGKGGRAERGGKE